MANKFSPPAREGAAAASPPPPVDLAGLEALNVKMERLFGKPLLPRPIPLSEAGRPGAVLADAPPPGYVTVVNPVTRRTEVILERDYAAALPPGHPEAVRVLGDLAQHRTDLTGRLWDRLAGAATSDATLQRWLDGHDVEFDAAWETWLAGMQDEPDPETLIPPAGPPPPDQAPSPPPSAAKPPATAAPPG